MSCHVVRERAAAPPPILRVRSRPLRIALLGNPNVGKSVVFGRLTGRYATVSNYPGTTVTISRGRALVGAEVCDIIDTPGVNALNGVLSEDEQLTRQLLLNNEADVVVQVADARNLRRALMLTSHLGRFRKPMVLALNMIDEASERGISIDTDALSGALGVPVVEMVAIEGRGMPELRDALTHAATPETPSPGDLARDAEWAHRLTDRVRRQRAFSLNRVQEGLARATRTPSTGIPILAAVLYAMYLFVGVFGAQVLVGLLEEELFGRQVNPASAALAERFIPVPMVREFLVGDYGLISMGLTYAIGIVLPVVATFFVMFGFLEDSGYIPRLAIFSDRIFRTMGLNGKAVLPMVLGLGCDTMATMTTRVLGTPKERLIAILLLALGIPCSAQLATIMGILGGISFAAVLTLFAVVLSQMLMVGWLAARALDGDRSDFMLELPPIRWPRLTNILVKTRMRVWWYLGEAVPLFLGGTALLFVVNELGGLELIARAGQPVVTGLLGLPASTAQIFVMGFVRRDYGAAGLFALAQSGQLTGVQSLVALTVMTLFVPCIANVLMIVRERGLRTALGILAVVTPIAVFTGAGLNYVLAAIDVQF